MIGGRGNEDNLQCELGSDGEYQLGNLAARRTQAGRLTMMLSSRVMAMRWTWMLSFIIQ